MPVCAVHALSTVSVLFIHCTTGWEAWVQARTLFQVHHQFVYFTVVYSSIQSSAEMCAMKRPHN
jgi:hypothetical protein